MSIQKRLLLVLFSTIFIFCSSKIEAQIDSVRLSQIETPLFNSVCMCISNTDSNGINTGSDLQKLLALCMTSNMTQIKTYVVALGVDTSNLNQESGSKIVKLFALKFIPTCPYLQVLVDRVKSKSN